MKSYTEKSLEFIDECVLVDFAGSRRASVMPELGNVVVLELCSNFVLTNIVDRERMKLGYKPLLPSLDTNYDRDGRYRFYMCLCDGTATRIAPWIDVFLAGSKSPDNNEVYVIDLTEEEQWHAYNRIDEQCVKHLGKGCMDLLAEAKVTNGGFGGEQLILTKDEDGIHLMSFRELYAQGNQDKQGIQGKQNVLVYHNGVWATGRLVREPRKSMYKVTTANHKELIVSGDYLHATMRGKVRTDQLAISDYLKFNDSLLCPKSDLGYAHGILIGMYVAAGSRANDGVYLTLNGDNYSNAMSILSQVSEALGHAEVSCGKDDDNIYPVTIKGNEVVSFIKRFVSDGVLSLDCLEESYAFRKGIIDGYYWSKGDPRRRVCAAATKKMRDHLEALIMSLGWQSEIFDGGIIYGITYDPCKKKCERNVYLRKDSALYFKVASIEPYEDSDEYAYNFEMPYFTLPGGMIVCGNKT